MKSFLAFLDHLVGSHGEDTAAVRHEIFFQLHKPWSRSRALLALVRDAALLTLQPGPRLRPGGAAGIVFAATLPGANGWGCLEPAMAAAQAAGCTITVVVHPRLGSRGRWLPRPSLQAFVEAMVALRRHARGGNREVPGLVVGAAMARRVLWRAAWQAALAHPGGAIVLHNDFDMMSAAAIGHGWPSLCLQHGVPTDEFFPTRADLQVVWGESSAAAYRAAGSAALVVDALGRSRETPAEQGPPVGIALVSQSHTTVYGPDLGPRLRALAANLPAGTRVLLHPGEGSGRNYDGLTHLIPERPPHPLLTPGQPRHLVIGFCSTALLDAARAGHDVVGLDWPAQGSAAALTVAAPPRRVPDAAAAILLYEQLQRDAELRAAVAAERSAWLARTFSPAEGGFVAALPGGTTP